MRRFTFTLLVLLAAATSAQAWNNKGHMVVARLAWNELKPDERAKVLKLLESHPHIEEFLRDDRPENIPQDEWVFMRAATWADWIKGGPASRRKFSRPTAHFINLPFVQPGSDVTPPKLPELTVVSQIVKSKLIATKGGSQEERAVEITWLFHLIGDIHQPLHCFTLYNDDFPEGDKGGNRSHIMIGDRVVQMHKFWDGLLGNSTTLSSIGSTVIEIDALAKKAPNAIKADLAAHTTPEEWAKESFAIAKRVAYLRGKLEPANDDDPADVPEVPQNYPEKAGETARHCAKKAGLRLASVLREVLAEN